MRINLFGGPGVGKSVLAARVFCELKVAGHNIEQVQEYVKERVYDGRLPVEFDQIEIFSSQLAREYRLAKSVSHLVTDSPLLQQLVYIKRDGLPFYYAIAKLCADFEKRYPSVNLFLDRGDIPYQEHGRYQNLDEAKQVDEMTLAVLKDHNVTYRVANARDHQQIVDFLLGTL